MEELPGGVHGGLEGCDFNVMGLCVEGCAVLSFVVGCEFPFLVIAELLEGQQLRVVWILFFPCGYGIFEFMYFESQGYCCGRRVCVCVFLGVWYFCGGCASVFVSVDGGG